MSEHQELSAGSILSLFDTTKQQRAAFAQQVITDIAEGNKNPLDVHLQIKSMQDLADEIIGNQEYKSALLDESAKHGKSFTYHNAKIDQREVGVKYDYSQCDDPILLDIQARAELVNKELKERQEFLKKVPAAGIEIRHEDELVTVFPPSKSSTTSVVVKLS
jgi:hypothetical protein